MTPSRLRKSLAALASTPLHPQWLVLRQRPRMLSWVKAHANGSVLDVGCGNGWLRKELGDAVEYIGVDYPSTVALGYAGRPDVLADAARLPIRDLECDTVVLLDVLEHVPCPEAALSEAFRVLRPGGKCLIHIPFMYPLHDEPHDYQRFSGYKLRMILSQVGFEVESVTESTSAVEAASALLSIALAKCILDALSARSISVLLAPLLVLAIPLVNLVGFACGLLFPRSCFMPFSYRVAASKRAKI